MDLILHYGVYGKGVNKLVILRYTEYTKTYYFSDLIVNYVWRAQPKVKNKRKASIIMLD